MAWQSGAVERLRGFPSPDLLLRTLLLHVARGYSLRETVARAKLANWTDISDVALLKRLRNSEEWLRLLCIELLRENVAYRLEDAFSRTIRIVDGTIVREPGKTGSQWRILYSIRLPSLVCGQFALTQKNKSRCPCSSCPSSPFRACVEGGRIPLPSEFDSIA